MTVDLNTLNVNQLVALDALLRECHVGRAARRMGVTQSAMSHTLRGLRQLLQDPLLVRVGNDMLPTPRAEVIAPRLREGLDALLSVVRGQGGFDPAALDRTFVLAVHDTVAASVLPRLYGQLHARAPHARLQLVAPSDAELQRQLAEGRADVALVPPILPLEGLMTRALGSAESVVLSRRDHPGIGRRLTLARYCRIPHAVQSMGDGPGFMDALLARHGRTRSVAVRVPYMHALAPLVADSDLLTTVAWPAARVFLSQYALAAWPLPLEVPRPALRLCWHLRYDAAPAQTFFRELVADTVDAVVADAGASLTC